MMANIVAMFHSALHMDDGYVNHIAIVQDVDGYHNHFLYDEDKGKGAAGTGPFKTIEDAKQDVIAHYCGRQKIQKRGRTNSRFHPLRSVWKTGGVCREVFQKRNKSCYFWKNHNRKLYKQGWSENIYH